MKLQQIEGDPRQCRPHPLRLRVHEEPDPRDKGWQTGAQGPGLLDGHPPGTGGMKDQPDGIGTQFRRRHQIGLAG
jgi:hypothetical protein